MKLILKRILICFIISILLFIIFDIIKYNLLQNTFDFSEKLTYIDINGKLFPIDSTELDLSDVIINDKAIEKIKFFENLKIVNLKGNKLATATMQTLENIYPNIQFIWDVQIANKTVDSSIETLDLSNCKINDLNEFKSSLSLLHKLKYLDMSDCNLSNEELAKLRVEFPDIKIVWKIYFSVWSLKTDAIAFSVLVGNFKYTYLTSETIDVFKYCTDLQALDLGHQKITDISVIGDYLPDLRILILADNSITDISPLAKLKHLHYLELFMNRVTDISPLSSCKELVDLNLAHIPTLYDFSPLLNNDFPLLERLCMQNSGGTTKYYNLIKAKYPETTIIHTGYGSTHSGWRTHPRYYAMIDMFHKSDYISDLFTKYDNIIN